MKKVAGSLRLDLAQYRELAAFAQFGTELDKATQARLQRGERTMEILKQDENAPMPVEHQIAIIYAATNGYLDDVPTEEITRFETAFHRHLDTEYQEVLKQIRETGAMDEETEEALKEAITSFKQNWGVPASGQGQESA